MGDVVNKIRSRQRSNQLLANAEFEYMQRYNGGPKVSVGSFNGYIHDRWYVGIQDGTISTIASGLLGEQQPAFAFRYQADNAGAGISVYQNLESFITRTVRGKTITLSVLAKRNALYTANLGLRVQKNATPNTLLGGTWTTIADTTFVNAAIPSGSSYAVFSVSVAIPDDTTAAGLRILFYHNGGAGNVGAQLDLAAPMLNIGAYRLPWGLYSRDTQSELHFLQRYCEVGSYNSGDFFGRTGSPIDSGASNRIQFKTTKRGVPNISIANRVPTIAVIVAGTAFENNFAINQDGWTRVFEYGGGGQANLRETFDWIADAEM